MDLLVDPYLEDTTPLGNPEPILPQLKEFGIETSRKVLGKVSTRPDSSLMLGEEKKYPEDLGRYIDQKAYSFGKCHCAQCDKEVLRLAEVRALGMLESTSPDNVRALYESYSRIPPKLPRRRTRPRRSR